MCPEVSVCLRGEGVKTIFGEVPFEIASMLFGPSLISECDYGADDDEDLERTAIARELPRRPSPPKIITKTDTTREN